MIEDPVIKSWAIAAQSTQAVLFHVPTENMRRIFRYIEALRAEHDRLRGGIEYVLDGYGLKGPDYRFQDGEDGDWITDHLIAALKGESHDR